MERRSLLKSLAVLPFFNLLSLKPKRSQQEAEHPELGLWKAWDSLPHGEIELYEVGGQVLFPVYAASGGLATNHIFYMFRLNDDGKTVSILAVEDDLWKSIDWRPLLKISIKKFERLSHSVPIDDSDMGRGITRRELFAA